jgi:mannose/cellobiose epimerase-like protein (N-acyl-D-glucosamine 2-epimerase family)
MSPEPNSSPGPGAGRERPLCTRSTAGAPADALELTLKVITAAYALLAAWQVAKALSPSLKLWEDNALAVVRAHLERPAERLPELAAADRAAIYDDTR